MAADTAQWGRDLAKRLLGSAKQGRLERWETNGTRHTSLPRSTTAESALREMSGGDDAVSAA